MKKEIALIAILFLITILPSSLAQTPIVDEAKGLEKKIDDLRDREISGTYLSEEWTKILRENPNTQWIYKLDPLFLFLFGYSFSLSWAFVAAFLIWTIIYSIFYPPIKSAFEGPWISMGITLCISAITSHYITPVTIAKVAELIKNIWYNLGLIFILLIIAIIANRLSKVFTKKYKAWKEEKRIRKLEYEAKYSKSYRKGVESIARGFEDELDD